MPSALDDATLRTIDEGRETVGAMLRSAQKDLQKIFVAFVVGFVGTFYSLYYWLWNVLKRATLAQLHPYIDTHQVQIIATTPFDVVLLQAKIALVVGIVVAFPLFLYFARKPLIERDLWPSIEYSFWKVAAVATASILLFLGGMAYGYFVFFPFMFNFLARNAISAGLEAHWSIVLWAQFVFLLTVSFGLAAQMPLAMTALSYSEVVPYETFRDKWRHATVGIFIFGAVFSPPDPFTQLMWAIPLLFLYGFSLYLAKVVVTARRGSEVIGVGPTIRRYWYVLLGVMLLSGSGLYYAFENGYTGVIGNALNTEILPLLGTNTTVPPIQVLLGLPRSIAVVLVTMILTLLVVVVAIMYLFYRQLDSLGGSDGIGERPETVDMTNLDAEQIRMAPTELFLPLSGDDAVAFAGMALDDGEPEKAQAILDRYDEVHESDTSAEHASSSGPSPSSGPLPLSVSSGSTSSAFRAPSGVRQTLSVGRQRVNLTRRLTQVWNVFLAVSVLVGGTVYALLRSSYSLGLKQYVLAHVAPLLPSMYATSVKTLVAPLPVLSQTEAALLGGVTALVFAIAVFGFFVLAAIWQGGRDPTAMDLDRLTAAEVRGVPLGVFTRMNERQVLAYANAAIQSGDDELARAILDRYDLAVAVSREPKPIEGDEPKSSEERTVPADKTLLQELTEGKRDEDEIGGYYRDLRFIYGSVTSKSFRIVSVFAIVMTGVFFWLYTGGIGSVKADFVSRLPAAIQADKLHIVALHPVEALIFEVQFSTLLAVAVTLPMIAYYAWPALRERNFVRGHRSVIFGWLIALTVGLFCGFAFGYAYVAPMVISYLVADAVRANMIISYRISDFMWLVFYTTVGIGILADIPVLMVLLNTAGVSYRQMRDHWREITIALMTFAALFTPVDIVTMFMLAIPLMVAYGVGIAVLFVLTLGGRRDLAPSGTH